ncbi:MAG: hypothetical protein WC514_00945 [Candidatus Paceibacterota bacterium]
MPKFKKISLKNIKVSFHASPKALADKAFLIFLGLFFVALIIGALVFYKYNNLIKESPSISKGSLQFKEEAYRDILTIWQIKEERLRLIDLKKYSDPFNAIPK